MLKNPVFDEHDVETYFQEIKFLKEQSNEFILQYIDHYFEDNKPCIITLYYKVSSGLFNTQNDCFVFLIMHYRTATWTS